MRSVQEGRDQAPQVEVTVIGIGFDVSVGRSKDGRIAGVRRAAGRELCARVEDPDYNNADKKDCKLEQQGNDDGGLEAEYPREALSSSPTTLSRTWR